MNYAIKQRKVSASEKRPTENMEKDGYAETAGQVFIQITKWSPEAQVGELLAVEEVAPDAEMHNIPRLFNFFCLSPRFY